MGKTKIKIVDDSIVEESKKKVPKVSRDKEDSLIAKLNAELGIKAKDESAEEARGDGEEGSRREATASNTSEDARRDTEPAGPRADDIESKKSKKTQKPGKAKPRSKKYLEATKDLDRTLTYSIHDAIDNIKKMSYAKFNESLEAHINTAQTGVRGLVSLPFASGKKLRIAAFGAGAKESGADVFGGDKTIEEIGQGKLDFDILITTPEWMPKLAKVAKILGPKGLMPNPKNGTITDDLKKLVESFQAGKIEYRTEVKAPIIHLSLGKLNQPTEELSQNVEILLQTLGKSKIKKVSLSSTMSPSVKVDLSHI